MWVYVHQFPNGKRYVGQTKRPLKVRWLSNGDGYKSQFVYKAILKYGWNNVNHTVYSVESQKEADYLEKYLIAFYNTTDRKNGYNISTGGEKNPNSGRHLSEDHRKKIGEAHIGKVVSEDTKRKLSEANKGKVTWMKGKHHTEEAIEKNRIAHLGKTVSDDTRQKMSNSMKGKNVGKIASEETKQRMRDNWEKHPEWNDRKKVKVVAITSSGEELIFDCIKDAAETLNVKNTSISNCLHNRSKTAGGYIWKKVEILCQ